MAHSEETLYASIVGWNVQRVSEVSGAILISTEHLTVHLRTKEEGAAFMRSAQEAVRLLNVAARKE